MTVGINLPARFPFTSTAIMLQVYEEMGADSYWALADLPHLVAALRDL